MKDTWSMFSKFIRLRDCLKTTETGDYGECVTCGRRYSFEILQAGHFIPRKYSIHLFNEKNVHIQCFGCNIKKKSNWVEYYEFMRQHYSLRYINTLIKTRNNPHCPLTRDELWSIYEKYKTKYEELQRRIKHS